MQRSSPRSIDKRKTEFAELEAKIGKRSYRTKSAIEKKLVYISFLKTPEMLHMGN